MGTSRTHFKCRFKFILSLVSFCQTAIGAGEQTDTIWHQIRPQDEAGALADNGVSSVGQLKRPESGSSQCELRHSIRGACLLWPPRPTSLNGRATTTTTAAAAATTNTKTTSSPGPFMSVCTSAVCLLFLSPADVLGGSSGLGGDLISRLEFQSRRRLHEWRPANAAMSARAEMAQR